jgi:integrase
MATDGRLATVTQLRPLSYPADAALPPPAPVCAPLVTLRIAAATGGDYQGGSLDNEGTPTMEHHAFRMHLLGQGRAERTATEYVRVIRRADLWLRDHHGHPLEATTPPHVRGWADQLPPSWSTRKQARTALGHWQTWAHHPYDLAGAVRVPRKPKMRPRALEDADAVKLELAAHQAGRRGLAVLLGLYLGMRCAEIAAATWTGWDGTYYEWQRVKTGDLARLPVHPRLAAALDREERWGPFLFPSGISATRPHVAPQTVWEWVRNIGVSCGVDVSTHQLRHTSISRVVETMGLRVGQEWAGHRDPEVTAGYSRVKDRQLTEAMASLGGLFGGNQVASAASGNLGLTCENGDGDVNQVA